MTRFAEMFDKLADMVEGKSGYEELGAIERSVVYEMFARDASDNAKPDSFIKRRVGLFFDILRNGWKYREFNDVSMPVALWRQVWSHFFGREVKVGE